MAEHSLMLRLLNEDIWGQDAGLIARLRAWPLFPLVTESYTDLKEEALYQSRIHGVGHIECTMLHGAVAAMEEGLTPADARLLLAACAYHDVGRVDDTLDDEHGLRSAQRIGELTGYAGEELKLLQAAVEAHSRPDRQMDAVIAKYAPADYARCRRLAELLKDSDGLDRVRVGDLDPRFLRRPGAADRADFARRLYRLYTGEEAPAGRISLPCGAQRRREEGM